MMKCKWKGKRILSLALAVGLLVADVPSKAMAFETNGAVETIETTETTETLFGADAMSADMDEEKQAG